MFSSFDQSLNKEKALFILDIDSTLFNVSPRNKAILDLYISLHNNSKKTLLKPLANLKFNLKDWGLDKAYSLLESKNAEAEVKSLRSFWKRHFFSGRFLPSDQAYPAILELIQLLHQKGHKIMYLTGRDIFRMKEGSLAQLRHWGFPLDQEEDLILKPDKKLVDGPYKQAALEKILESTSPNTPVYFWDNEPLVLHYAHFPEHSNFEVLHILSTHSSRTEALEDWPSLAVEDYPKLLKHFERTLKKWD